MAIATIRTSAHLIRLQKICLTVQINRSARTIWRCRLHAVLAGQRSWTTGALSDSTRLLACNRA